MIYWVIEIYWVRDELYIIIETWTDKWILTFSIQVLEFWIASLEIAISITSIEEISITFVFDFLSMNDWNLSYDMHDIYKILFQI